MYKSLKRWTRDVKQWTEPGPTEEDGQEAEAAGNTAWVNTVNGKKNALLNVLIFLKLFF